MESRSAATLVTLAALVSFCAGRWSMSVVFRPTPLTDVASDVRGSLYSPPAGHGVVRVPSTVTDPRGEVHNLELGISVQRARIEGWCDAQRRCPPP